MKKAFHVSYIYQWIGHDHEKKLKWMTGQQKLPQLQYKMGERKIGNIMKINRKSKNCGKYQS